MEKISEDIQKTLNFNSLKQQYETICISNTIERLDVYSSLNIETLIINLELVRFQNYL